MGSYFQGVVNQQSQNDNDERAALRENLREILPNSELNDLLSRKVDK